MRIELNNEIQANYYDNNYLPSVIGGDVSTNIFKFLGAMQSIMNLYVETVTNLSNWTGGRVTWYTERLSSGLPVPFFEGDSDADYLERVRRFQNIKYNRSDLSNYQKLYLAIAYFMNSFDVGDYVVRDHDIIFSRGSTSHEWSDNNDIETEVWDTEKKEVSDETIYYVSEHDTEDSFDSIDITIESSVDSTFKNYWTKAENYTKIVGIISYFVPAHLFYELHINYLTE